MAARSTTRIVGGRIGDPTRETVGQPIPVILPEPGILFARRAERLESLARADHPMADWLRFTARLSRAQHEAIATLPMAEPVAITEGEPPLGYDSHHREAYWRMALAVVLRAVDGTALPHQVREAISGLRARDTATVDALADAYLRGDTQKAERGEAVFIAASVAAYFTHRAAVLPAANVHLLAQRGCCPVCGFAPVAGVVTAAGQAPGVRYLHCGLCATAWNHVRAVCIACGSSRGLALHGIEGDEGAVQAETCDECRSYVKMLYQAKDMAVEPMADDLASLGLDMLVGEAGYRRNAANPLVIGGQ
jgi:FdhE protein